MPEDGTAARNSTAKPREVKKARSSDFALLEASFQPLEAWFDQVWTRAPRRDHPKKSSR
jgi:hypothetical protein